MSCMSEEIEVSGIDRAAGEGAVVVALVRVEGGQARVVCSRVLGEGESLLAAAGRLYEEETVWEVNRERAREPDASSGA